MKKVIPQQPNDDDDPQTLDDWIRSNHSDVCIEALTEKQRKHWAVMRQQDEWMSKYGQMPPAELSEGERAQMVYLLHEGEKAFAAVMQEHQAHNAFFKSVTKGLEEHPECKTLGELFDRHPEYFSQLDEASLDSWKERTRLDDVISGDPD